MEAVKSLITAGVDVKIRDMVRHVVEVYTISQQNHHGKAFDSG